MTISLEKHINAYSVPEKLLSIRSLSVKMFGIFLNLVWFSTMLSVYSIIVAAIQELLQTPEGEFLFGKIPAPHLYILFICITSIGLRPLRWPRVTYVQEIYSILVKRWFVLKYLLDGGSSEKIHISYLTSVLYIYDKSLKTIHHIFLLPRRDKLTKTQCMH